LTLSASFGRAAAVLGRDDPNVAPTTEERRTAPSSHQPSADLHGCGIGRGSPHLAGAAVCRRRWPARPASTRSSSRSYRRRQGPPSRPVPPQWLLSACQSASVPCPRWHAPSSRRAISPDRSPRPARPAREVHQVIGVDLDEPVYAPAISRSMLGWMSVSAPAMTKVLGTLSLGDTRARHRQWWEAWRAGAT
jgi:hypothetical protein